MLENIIWLAAEASWAPSILWTIYRAFRASRDGGDVYPSNKLDLHFLPCVPKVGKLTNLPKTCQETTEATSENILKLNVNGPGNMAYGSFSLKCCSTWTVWPPSSDTAAKEPWEKGGLSVEGSSHGGQGSCAPSPHAGGSPSPWHSSEPPTQKSFLWGGRSEEGQALMQLF